MAFLELSGDGGGHRNGHHSHTPHHVFNHHPHDSLSSLRVVISGAKQEVEPLLYGLGFEALDEFRKEGIFNIGDDQTEEVAMASRQAACMRVLIVLQVLNYLEDALFCLRGHVASPVQDVGNCCDRDTCTLGYIFDPARHLFTVPCAFLKHALDRAPRSMLSNLIIDVSGYRKRLRRAKSTI